ncbi:MAG TPA: DUF1631 domain-containing protein [Ramlibacter sp.]|jgi:hypothetical protein|uniref:DUF1631 domain-containing protein n=1 Tax=Ramlibacter sp. TaxID=1917967 RepID=UPI002D6B90F6|nr:DUF1631 domain-containing protein [Ramlibacter sp.]HZY17103.1 DUF1631 domain-containing protein [Ramlibacter sp.]
MPRQVREHFVGQLERVLPGLSDALRLRMFELVDSAASSREALERRDAAVDFDRQRHAWCEGVRTAWRKAMVPPTATGRSRLEGMNLELIADDVVENKILASRLALAVQDKAGLELNDLQVRMQHLEGGAELAPQDVLRPEAVAQLMVEQWAVAGLGRSWWQLVQDVIHKHMVDCLVAAYHATNQFLIDCGVLPDIDLSGRVKRAPATSSRAGDIGPQQGPAGDAGWAGHAAGHGGGDAGPAALAGDDPRRAGAAGVPRAAAGIGPGARPGSTGRGAGGGRAAHDESAFTGHTRGLGGGVADETRMLTGSTPLARARMRASGVIGQLKRLLVDRVGAAAEQPSPPSPALAEAIGRHATQIQTQVQSRMGGESSNTLTEVVVFDDAAVEKVAGDLRQRTGDLKKKAATSSEKATIEIVALMFQSILSEERIPPAVRVWFARLQMPVLRVALAEPEFFGTLQHPARQLIDRMGSCVLGFNAATIGGSALETEIKRVVQVIEQYPETGRRVFQLVYEEFQKFLAKFLTEKDETQRLVSVAQQVEQKETMAIQYTIELRKMLQDLPVREEIREFLFKVWAEVLAVAAVKYGVQHAETVSLKKSAADLVWSASAKPNRNDRARVIQELPNLLQRLRNGMSLMGLTGQAQERQIKTIGDTLADAFMAKTETIPQAQIDAMTKRLANLEDFISDDPSADLPLDAESLEVMLGIDASRIEVVADGGSKPSDAMQAWALELQQGNWFTLDHNGGMHQVQYVWRSDRRHLHLFISPEGRSYLVQAGRLASYLQAGLLLPAEEEALTVRATRDALAKLDANPERLLT